MAYTPLTIAMNVERVEQYRDLARKLKAAGAGELRKALNASIKESGQPILREVQDAALGLHTVSSHQPSKKPKKFVRSFRSTGGGGRRRRTYASVQAARRAHKADKDVRAAAIRAAKRETGLRHNVAKATKLEVTARGVKFVVRSDQLPESQRSLPRHMNSEKGWRHPVFGDREDWVDQKMLPAGFFSKTIGNKSNSFRNSLLTKLEEVKKNIES